MNLGASLQNLRSRIAALEDEIALRDERIRQLEQELGFNLPAPAFLGLTKSEAICFGALLKREIVSKDGIMAALYFARPDDEPYDKIVDIFIYNLRQKLQKFNITIENIPRQSCWRLSPAAKARYAALLAQREAA